LTAHWAAGEKTKMEGREEKRKGRKCLEEREKNFPFSLPPN